MCLFLYKTKFCEGVSLSTASEKIKSFLALLLRDKLEEESLKCSFYSFVPDVFIYLFFLSLLEGGHRGHTTVCRSLSFFILYILNADFCNMPFQRHKCFLSHTKIQLRHNNIILCSSHHNKNSTCEQLLTLISRHLLKGFSSFCLISAFPFQDCLCKCHPLAIKDCSLSSLM